MPRHYFWPVKGTHVKRKWFTKARMRKTRKKRLAKSSYMKCHPIFRCQFFSQFSSFCLLSIPLPEVPDAAASQVDKLGTWNFYFGSLQDLTSSWNLLRMSWVAGLAEVTFRFGVWTQKSTWSFIWRTKKGQCVAGGTASWVQTQEYWGGIGMSWRTSVKNATSRDCDKETERAKREYLYGEAANSKPCCWLNWIGHVHPSWWQFRKIDLARSLSYSYASRLQVCRFPVIPTRQGCSDWNWCSDSKSFWIEAGCWIHHCWSIPSHFVDQFLVDISRFLPQLQSPSFWSWGSGPRGLPTLPAKMTPRQCRGAVLFHTVSPNNQWKQPQSIVPWILCMEFSRCQDFHFRAQISLFACGPERYRWCSLGKIQETYALGPRF